MCAISDTERVCYHQVQCAEESRKKLKLVGFFGLLLPYLKVDAFQQIQASKMALEILEVNACCVQVGLSNH